jgi:hypothetical protein
MTVVFTGADGVTVAVVLLTDTDGVPGTGT